MVLAQWTIYVTGMSDGRYAVGGRPPSSGFRIDNEGITEQAIYHIEGDAAVLRALGRCPKSPVTRQEVRGWLDAAERDGVKIRCLMTTRNWRP